MSETERNDALRQEARRVLDPAKLMDEAKATAKLDDWGDTRFIAPMTRMLERAVNEVDFHRHGLQVYKTDIVRYLVNRLRFQEDLKRHPEILDEDVSDPIIVIGLPRSGTTKMQRILSAPSDVQKLYMWRMRNPAPFPDAVPGQPDPRMGLARPEDTPSKHDDEKLRSMRVQAQAGHESAVGEPDEELVLFDFVLDESVIGFSVPIPMARYSDWLPGGDRPEDYEAYRYVRSLMQYLQWQDGGKRKRPWIMKSIHHLAHIDALLDSFPNATLVHCHRNPLSSVPSFAKLMWTAWGRRALPEKSFAGTQLFGWTSTIMSRYLEARNRLRLDDRIVDVSYEDVRSNIMPSIREIYRRSGRQLTAEAEAAMLAWENANAQGKLGKFDYSLEEVGMTAAMVENAFGDYMRRFIHR